MRLVKYEKVTEAGYADFIQEWEAAGEDMVPFAIDRKGRSFAEMMAYWTGAETEAAYAAGFVPATLYFLVKEDGRVLGAIHLRHELNEKLAKTGGHIGYGVRPSERGKGYAERMLGAMLKMKRVRSLGRVLVTCDDDNLPSAKTIEHHGGVLENKVKYKGVPVRRYWIDVQRAGFKLSQESIAETFVSQYLAALEMLKGAVVKCPSALWNDPAEKTKFWHIAYHALYYTHLYLQERADTFKAWEKHHPDYQYLGPMPKPPHELPKIGAVYSRAEVLEYLGFCAEQVVKRLPNTDMEAPSGFDWLKMGKLELQVYAIRHLQQHAGELIERLGTRAGVELDWVSVVRGEKAEN